MDAKLSSRSLQNLGELTTHVDRLSANHPLRSHPTLRSQIRRSAVEALTHAACAVEAMSKRDYERLYHRCLGALDELSTYSRLAAGQGALTPHEFHGLRREVMQTYQSVHLCLEAVRPQGTTETQTERDTAETQRAALWGVA